LSNFYAQEHSIYSRVLCKLFILNGGYKEGIYNNNRETTIIGKKKCLPSCIDQSCFTCSMNLDVLMMKASPTKYLNDNENVMDILMKKM